jgi:uncharacterized protein (TIGR03435 family)
VSKAVRVRKPQITFAYLIFAVVFSLPLIAQSSKPEVGKPGASTFEVADVHVSPHRDNPYMRVSMSHDRLALRDATMVDLIAIAYNVDSLSVLQGPAWLDLDHFDIIAKAPRTTSEDGFRLMLGALLADRFQLVVHSEKRPLPAFVLTVGGTSKLRPSPASTDDSEQGCQYQQPKTSASADTMVVTFSCHAVTMDYFAQFLHDAAGNYLPKPVVNATDLKGKTWDFDISWSARAPKTADSGITIFDALKQLGLKAEPKTAPLPAVIVDRASEIPTANSPDLAKLLPPPPPATFDVAVIKPSSPNEKHFGIQLNGGTINVTHGSPETLIAFAWDIDKAMIADGPKWLSQDFYDVMGKAADSASPNGPPASAAPNVDVDDIKEMLRSLLADRFKLVVHQEERPFDSYTLLAANPKLKMADPANRASCRVVWGDVKDPSIEVLTCQNTTMSQFAQQLQSPASGYIKSSVLDATHLDGAYDFTLRFNSLRDVQTRATPSPSADPAVASDPGGAISLFDAVDKQLGLKLEKQKRPTPVLVIDHIEQTPTGN